MELFLPSFEGKRKKSTRPAMRVFTAGTGRACIHDLMPARSLSRRPVNLDTPFILLILVSNTLLTFPARMTFICPVEELRIKK